MNRTIRNYFSKIGRRGGLKSRRTLGSATARDMVRVRETRRAFRRFHAQCFWSYDPDALLGLEDIPWVVEQLRKNGGRQAWEAAMKLCR